MQRLDRVSSVNNRLGTWGAMPLASVLSVLGSDDTETVSYAVDGDHLPCPGEVWLSRVLASSASERTVLLVGM